MNRVNLKVCSHQGFQWRVGTGADHPTTLLFLSHLAAFQILYHPIDRFDVFVIRRSCEHQVGSTLLTPVGDFNEMVVELVCYRCRFISIKFCVNLAENHSS